MVIYHDIHNTSCISCTIVYNKTIEREEATMPNTNPYIHLADKLLEIVETPQQLTKLSDWLADSQTVRDLSVLLELQQDKKLKEIIFDYLFKQIELKMWTEMGQSLQDQTEKLKEHSIEHIINDSIPEYKIIGGTDGKKQ
tara:strand:- start:568 stop:987 length:420 start_codon:yes stop_codon:yes gene_type:complete